MLTYLHEHDLVVDWPQFIEDGFKQGWKEKTIRSRLRETIPDVYGRPFYEGWKVRFEAYLKQRGSDGSSGE